VRMIEQRDHYVAIRVKVVPNASRDQIVGPLGDALKVKVAAPPEAGRANAAVVALMAEALGVPAKQVSVAAGQTQPHKVLAVSGVTLAQVKERLSQFSR